MKHIHIYATHRRCRLRVALFTFLSKRNRSGHKTATKDNKKLADKGLEGRERDGSVEE